MKKVLSLVLALLMTASTASAVLADDVVAIAEEPVAVEEVAEEVEAGQYDKAIEFLANYKIFKGYNADDTGAEDLIQRYQMALFVARIATGWVEDEVWEDGPENWSEFSDIDVEPVNKYYGALSFANQKGIIEGYGNGKFGPTDSITYQNALTMVVRTLGYTGLDWPWGYIQKAVELGLTDGITGVAYTDELTRGEVAQIIYNALFAKTKDGANLALKNFGIEFGWEKVVITASNINSFEKLEKAPAVAKDLVEFKLLENDGNLADDAYLALAEDFGLDYTKHEDDLAVGDAYYVLFEKDAKSALVDIVAVESLLVDVIENEGKTDDDADEQDYAIQAFLENYTLVEKYTTNEYLNIFDEAKLGHYNPELLVWNTVDGNTVDVINGYEIAIDWNTGDILGYSFDKDGKKIDLDKDEDTTADLDDYVVVWNYNPTLKRYYKIDKNSDGEVVGIDYMTDAEFEKHYESVAVKVATPFKGFKGITSIADTAYATLEVFDTNLDGVADRGLYESYKLGYFYESTEKCSACDADKKSYKIDNVGTLENAKNAAKDQSKTVDTTTFEQIVEGVCDHGTAWFVEGYEPEVAYDEEGEATGYKAGYVIYNADKETGAIKVVKNIDDGSDKDSYVATGVVRAYNVAKETITIGEDDLTMNYDELAGTGFYLVDKSAGTKAAYTALLRDLFNQFVTYVVVDGELVHIAPKGDTKSEVIVVDSYAGIAKDGAIVVYGYSTEDLEYAEFRIANYNNWYGGDYYYYLDEDKAEASFTKGAIYAISSYNAEEDLYYVQLAGQFEVKNNQATGKYIVNSDYVNAEEVTIKEAADGYATVTFTNTKIESGERKMKSDDKYVIISEYAETNPYAPVIVYKGKLGEGWEVKGDLINTTGYNNGTYVIVNATIVEGFADTYETGLALLLKDLFYSAAADEDLLGAYTREVYAFDVLNGADKIYTATNKHFDMGSVYFTQQDVLVEDQGVLTMENLVKVAQEIYANDTAATTAYGFGTAIVDEDNYDELLTSDKNVDEQFVYAAINNYYGLDNGDSKFFGTTKWYSDLIDDVTVFTVSYDDDTDEIKEVKKIDKAAFEKLVKGTSAYNYPAYVVYNTETTDAVVYIDLVYVTGVTTKESGTTDAVVVWEDTDGHDAKIEAVVDYTADYVDGVLVGATVNGINFTFVGDAIDTFDHANIDNLHFHFGEEGACDVEAVLALVKFAGVDLEPVGSSMVETVYANHDDEADCKLVKSIYVPVDEYVEDAWSYIGIEVVFDTTENLANGGWYEGVDETLAFEFNVIAYAEGELVNKIVARA